MKPFFSLLLIASFAFLCSSNARASSYAGCVFVAKVVQVSKACAKKPAPRVATLGGCSLQLKVVAIGKQFGIGGNYCTRKKLLGKVIWAKKIASRLAKKQIPSNRKTYYTASLHSALRFSTLKKHMLLIVRYEYTDGMSPKGVSTHDRWTIKRSYQPNQAEPKKKKRAVAPVPVPRPVRIPTPTR